MLDRTSTPDINEVGADLYELKFLRCEIESIEDTQAALGDPLFEDERRPNVIAEIEITNLDDVRRRFDVRATLTDANNTSAPFNNHHTNRLNPGETSVEIIRMPAIDSEIAPFTCTAEVWDSIDDVAFPDD